MKIMPAQIKSLKKAFLKPWFAVVFGGLILLSCGPMPVFKEVNSGPEGKGFLFQGRLGFRLFVPSGPAPAGGYPMVIFLHGNGEQGNGPENFGNKSWARSLTGALQAKEPFVVLQPRCRKGDVWTLHHWQEGTQPQPDAQTESMQLMTSLIKEIEKTYPIDPHRVYLVGFSMGGYAVWEMVLRSPHEFAAAVPISGSGDPAKIKLIGGTKIWDIHSASDQIVPVSGSREMVKAIRENGDSIRYTEYDNLSHEETLPRAVQMNELWDWIFLQRRDF